MVVSGREVYAWHPQDVARSKLWAKLAGQGLGVTATSRNWTTVEALLELADRPLGRERLLLQRVELLLVDRAAVEQRLRLRDLPGRIDFRGDRADVLVGLLPLRASRVCRLRSFIPLLCEIR